VELSSQALSPQTHLTHGREGAHRALCGGFDQLRQCPWTVNPPRQATPSTGDSILGDWLQSSTTPKWSS